MLSLNDKVVVIIGGTNGLGLSAVRACQRTGARGVMVGRSEASVKAALDELGDRASAGVSATYVL